MIRESMLKDMLDAVSEGVYFVDSERTITYWNQSAERITGFASAEVMGRRCSDNVLKHVDDAGKELCLSGCPLSAVMESGSDRRVDVFLHHRDGHRVPVAVRAVPYIDGNDAVLGAIEIFTDRSERIAILSELQELRKENLTDALTGLGNRRYLDIRLDSLLQGIRTGGPPFGLLMLDIDHFKKVNDVHGHATGDRVLRMAARTLANAARRGDVAARWGGEEFMVLAPKADAGALAGLAERIRTLVERSWITLEDGRGLSVTVSAGGTTSRTGDDAAVLVQRADTLLYRCKEGGRNRTMVE